MYLLIVVLALSVSAFAETSPITNIKSILNDLVVTNTTNLPGNEARAVKVAAAILKKADISYEISEFAPGRENIVARLKGNGTSKPLLIIAHTDVVPADGQKWTVDPHKVTEKDGYLLGRGVSDDLGYAASALQLMVILKESGTKFNRDIILALTGDEERGGEGVQYILSHKPELLRAEIALNEGAGVVLDEKTAKPKYAGVEAAQKIYQDFELVAKGVTGHSSKPLPNNAIYRLSKALTAVEAVKFKPHLNPVTRAFFQARAELEEGETAKAMAAVGNSKGELPSWALKILLKNIDYFPLLQTTCVATQLSGGTAPNALPGEAKAMVNCRILPDETVDGVKAKLTSAISNSEIELVPQIGGGGSGPSPVEGKFIDALRKLAEQELKIPVIPAMSTGATDSRYLRNAGIPSYGFGPIFIALADARRAHGIDERISVEGLKNGFEFFHKLVLEIANQ